MKKKTLVIGAIATVAVVVGGLALAQSPGTFGPPLMRGMDTDAMGPGAMRHMAQRMMGPMGMMHQKGPGMGLRTMQGGPALADPTQIDALKDELGITAAQEPAWSKYAKAVQAAAAAMKTAREGVDPNAVTRMTPQDRYAFVTKMREQAQKQFDSVQTATDELLATLDDAQKQTAREVLPGLAAFGPGPTRDANMRGPMHSHQ